MRSILFRADPAAHDALTTGLWQHGTLGILEEPEGWRAFFEDNANLSAILEGLGATVVSTRQEAEHTPPDFVKQDWDPILVGQQFWIAPSWVCHPTPPGRIRLTIDTGNAFGTGRHETTQLALEALEQYLTPGDTVLDIGSGSGILSQAALMLGAGGVFSCDLEPSAITASKPQLRSGLFLGTADAVRSLTGDIVLANISTKVIDALAWELKRVTKPTGLLVLTGFVHDNPPIHFAPEKVFHRGDWLCWLCRPDPTQSLPKPYIHPLQWW